MTAADLAQGLRGCPLLERLSVAGLKPPLERLVPPTGLPRLTHLDVSDTGLTSNSLRRIGSLFPSLGTLSIRGCRAVTSSGPAAYLPRLRQLRSLDLRHVPAASRALLDGLQESSLVTLRMNGENLKGGDINAENNTRNWHFTASR